MAIEIYKRAWAAKVKGSEKLMLLALAEHANSDGICWPGYPKLAGMLGVTERQAMRIIDKLEDAGHIRRWENRGRGHSNLYFVKVGLSDEEINEVEAYIEQLIHEKGDTGVRFYKRKKVTSTSGINEEKVTSRAVKGDTHVTRTVKNHQYKDSTNSKELATPEKISHSHPAIQTFQRVFERNPRKNVYRDIAGAIGELPADLEFWERVLTAWKLCPYSPTNYAGMIDCFKNRKIPSTNGAKRNGTKGEVPHGDPTNADEWAAMLKA